MGSEQCAASGYCPVPKMDNDPVDHTETVDHIHSSYCLLMSTLLLAATAVVTAALRSVIRHRLPPSLLSHCLLDFLCGLELCVCGLELGTVLDIYDIPVYSFFLWMVLTWQALSWGSSTANPYGHLLRWSGGGEVWWETLTRVVAGTVGALTSYTLIAQVWEMEMSHFHSGRAHRSAAGVCGSDLQVSVVAGVLVELLGTLACFLAGSLLADVPQLKDKPFARTALDSAASVALVIAAFDLTGGYYNPALAMGLKLGCGPADPAHMTHLAVYWLGPCIGAYLAGPLYISAQQLVVTKEEKKTQ